MSNIKTIEVIEPIFGLNVGDTLTRLDENSNFTNTSELVGDGYMVSNSVSLVSDIIEGANAFKVIEYFDEPVKEESKCKCTTYKDLKNELSMYKDLYEFSLESNDELHDKLQKLENRIVTKRKEFEEKLESLSKSLSSEIGLISGETLEKLSEAYAVHYNMIDLLKKLTA
jgi:hypothetical protein